MEFPRQHVEQAKSGNLPRFDNLSADLWCRNGFEDMYDETVIRSNWRLYTPEEAEELLIHLGAWLPHITGDESVHQTDTQTVTRVKFDGQKLKRHDLHQSWGARPSPGDFQATGPIVEVAGPAFDEDGDMSAKYDVEPKYASNIAYAEDKPGYAGPVNFAADVMALPLAPRSVGTIYCSALPSHVPEMHAEFSHLNQKALQEITDAIKPDGYLVWECNLPENCKQLIAAGFDPVYLETRATIYENRQNGDHFYARFLLSGVYQKPLIESGA